MGFLLQAKDKQTRGTWRYTKLPRGVNESVEFIPKEHLFWGFTDILSYFFTWITRTFYSTVSTMSRIDFKLSYRFSLTTVNQVLAFRKTVHAVGSDLGCCLGEFGGGRDRTLDQLYVADSQGFCISVLAVEYIKKDFLKTGFCKYSAKLSFYIKKRCKMVFTVYIKDSAQGMIQWRNIKIIVINKKNVAI